MKKVLMLVPGLQNKGPIIVAKDIVEYCEDPKIEIEFLSLRKNSIENLEKMKNYKIHEINIGKIPYKFFKLKKKIKELKPDLIHCHGFWPTILAVLILNDYKIISTLHNNPNEDFKYKYGKVNGWLMTRILLNFQKKLNINIAISKYIEEIHKKMGLKNVMTIYNGIPEIKFFEKSVLESTDFKLILVSGLHKRKNIFFIIEVIKKIKEYIPTIQLKIIGEGQERKKLESKVKQYMLEDNIIFLGEKKREEIYSELNKSDIFIFSSLSEGFGLVIVEALKMGVPVVTSNIPVMKELIISGKNGIICDLNVNKYVEAILEIKKNLNEYKKNTQIYFNENFLAENMSKHYIELYKNL